MRFLPVCWLLTHVQQYLARFQKESDMHEILVQVRPDLYALAWLVGITLLLSWLLLHASKALHKWRGLIQQETAHQAEQAAILSHAVSLSRPEDWVSGNPHHHLGRDASVIRAFAADQAGFDAGDVQSGFGQGAGRVLAARSHADHDHICVLWFAHAVLLPCAASNHAVLAWSGRPFCRNSPDWRHDGVDRQSPAGPFQ